MAGSILKISNLLHRHHCFGKASHVQRHFPRHGLKDILLGQNPEWCLGTVCHEGVMKNGKRDLLEAAAQRQWRVRGAVTRKDELLD